jgi:ribonuclease-3
LQEIAQQKTGQIPRYRVIRSEGPDHDKWFSIEVSLHGKPIATGEGSSKKSAEQEAARIALERWESEGQEVLLNMGVSKDEDQTS